MIGIEIDYSTMAEQVDNIRLYDNGYAFINDAEGNIIYHPYIDVTSMSEDEIPKAPEGLLSENKLVHYTFDGVEKEAVWRELENGMRINVTVPMSEINESWYALIRNILIVSLILLGLFILLTFWFTGRITKPLHKLTKAAEEVNKGNYDVDLNYHGKDEVGLLTHTFRELTGHLKVYIDDLNSLAYADSLTSVHNKGAFDIYIRNLQIKVDDEDDKPEFGIAIFDCDDLKKINDLYGHDKGDIYLKNASAMICRVFSHSPVFRTGGDEFAIILQNGDFEIREELARVFNERCTEANEAAKNPWEEVRVSTGLAVYDPETDSFVGDVARRADRLMYESKRIRKVGRDAQDQA